MSKMDEIMAKKIISLRDFQQYQEHPLKFP
jgi:hypothetical protein